MKLKIAKLIRILTVAPVMALATLCTLYATKPEIFGGLHMLIIAIVFLFILPISAYPLQPIIPHFKSKGREGQRNLAMLFAVVGYVAGCITNLFMNAPASLWIIYLDYLISGALVVSINKLLHLRASAHACGIVGPAFLLLYFGQPIALAVGLALYVAALWASLVMKRHTWQQFVGGAVIPVVVLALLHLIRIIAQ